MPVSGNSGFVVECSGHFVHGSLWRITLRVRSATGALVRGEVLDAVPMRLLQEPARKELDRGAAAGARSFELVLDDGGHPPLELEIEEFLGPRPA